MATVEVLYYASCRYSSSLDLCVLDTVLRVVWDIYCGLVVFLRWLLYIWSTVGLYSDYLEVLHYFAY